MSVRRRGLPMMTFTEAVAALPDGRREGGTFRAPCPMHGTKDRNLSVWPGEDGNACFNCWSHGCRTRDILGALGAVPGRSKSSTVRDMPKPNKSANVEYARRTWDESSSAKGTLVEVYFRSRGIRIAPPASMRFHPSLKHLTGVFLPAMVAAVQNLEGQIIAIHRTWLRADGSGKAEVQPDKAMLGPTRGGAVRFARPAERLAVAEGIETALSIAQACPDLAVWAALSTAGLRALELPAIVREVIICADNDEPGRNAAEAAAKRFSGERRRVRVARPGTTNDFNDLLRI
jgi:putative DNA primase/helicase